MRKIFFILLITTFIVSCGSTSKKSVQRYDRAMSLPAYIAIDTVQLEMVNVALKGLGYDGNLLASSMQQSQINAQAGGAGAGLAGALIAMAVMQEVGRNSLQEERNKPVAKFLETVNGIDWDELFKSSSLATDFKLISLDTLKQEPEKYKNTYIMTPTMNVAANYVSLQLAWELKKYTKRKNGYRNYFQINTHALFPMHQSLSKLNEMNEDEIVTILNRSIVHMKPMIEIDFAGNSQNTTQQSIRFARDGIKYYERGTVLKDENNQLIYRNLRGELKLHPYDERL